MFSSEILRIPEPRNWQTLLQSHSSWLTSVLYARLRDTHAVDEVMQETALAASRQTGVPCDEDGICKWLYRVAIRQSMLYRRREARSANRVKQLISRQNQGGSSAQETDPVQLLIASEQQELVREAVTKLSARDYEVLLLKYTQGWNCREIAQRIGVSESAVKSRLLRARQNLRTLLLKLNEHWDLP